MESRRLTMYVHVRIKKLHGFIIYCKIRYSEILLLLTEQRMRISRLVIALIIAALSGILSLTNTQLNPVTGEKQRVALSPEEEVSLGLQAAPQMAAQFGGLHPDPQVQAYIKQVGKKVVQASGARQTPYEFDFHVLRDSETVNAFALPGGQIFITAELLSRLENEAQLAGVLGHEVGHVLGRHAAERLAKAKLTQGLVGAASVAGSSDLSGGQAAAMIANMVGQMVTMRFGRQDELESDMLGVRFMAEAGYNPSSLIRVMEILAQSRGGNSSQPEFMNTHPDPGNRTQRIEQEITALYPNGIPKNLSLGDAEKFKHARAQL